MKSHARVVVVGGGVMGVGLLYHLALEGWSDIVLIEKGELTSGSTWHAAGQCPHFNGSLNMTKVHLYGTELYPQLEKLTGQAVSWHGCGGLRLACTDEEVNWLKYVYGISRLAGYECEIIGPSEIKQYHPFLDTTGVKAAFRTVTDGHVAPADITNAMAAGARQLGAEIVRRNRVMDIKLLPNGEWRVFTEQGTIDCEHVVNSAGSYCDVVGAWTGHNVPIANMLHHYVITEPLKELIDLDMELPVVRDPYSHAYLREETNGVLVGPYETATAHVCWDGQPPRWDYESELEAPELDRIMPWLEKATERLPLFGQTGVKSIISGAITHTGLIEVEGLEPVLTRDEFKRSRARLLGDGRLRLVLRLHRQGHRCSLRFGRRRDRADVLRELGQVKVFKHAPAYELGHRRRVMCPVESRGVGARLGNRPHGRLLFVGVLLAHFHVVGVELVNVFGRLV